MKPITIIIAKYSAILFVWALLLWWALFYSPLHLPEYVPNTPVKLYGLAFSGFMLTILILSQKEALSKIPALSILKLFLIGTAICFVMEVMFQLMLSFTYTADKMSHFFRQVIVSTISGMVLSFFVAFQLKIRRIELTLLIIFPLVVIACVVVGYFSNSEELYKTKP